MSSLEKIIDSTYPKIINAKKDLLNKYNLNINKNKNDKAKKK